MTTAADLLEQAADKLSEPGAWGRGTDPGGLLNGRQCAYTAICGASFAAKTRPAPRKRAFSILGAHLNIEAGVANLWKWNDAPERTQAEVVATLREAAAIARAQGQSA